MAKEEDITVIATNRKARHDFHILQTFEAGLSLRGAEVKSLRGRKASFADSYAKPVRGEIILYNLHIAAYEHDGREVPDPTRPRRLLLNRREIRRLDGRVSQEGLTIVPLRLYFRGPYAKIELGLARGKRKYDHRHDVAERDAKRAARRAMKHDLR
jgi:SsrA-binding protein